LLREVKARQIVTACTATSETWKVSREQRGRRGRDDHHLEYPEKGDTADL